MAKPMNVTTGEKIAALSLALEDILKEVLTVCQSPIADANHLPIVPPSSSENGINPSSVYKVSECAQLMRTNREQVYAWIRTGGLPAFHLSRDAQKWLVKGVDLVRLIEKLKEEHGNA